MKRNKPVVMIVDDAVEWRQQLTQCLEEPCFVIAAANGTEALEYAKLKRPDLILLDMKRTDLSSRDPARIIRNAYRRQQQERPDTGIRPV